MIVENEEAKQVIIEIENKIQYLCFDGTLRGTLCALFELGYGIGYEDCKKGIYYEKPKQSRN